MVPSILQGDERRCIVTGATSCLHRHHILHGPLRNLSERMGFTCWLRWDIHMSLHDHRPPFQNLDRELKRECQIVYERDHTRDDWMKIVGRSYL